MSFTANIDDVVAENRNHLLGKHPKWSRVRLKEVATILNGYPFESERFKRSGGTPLIRIRDILGGRTETFYDGEFDSTFLVKRGEILIGMDGDFHCEPWMGDPALLNQRVCKITPDESRYAKQFLRYLLPGYLSAINAQTPSVTVKHLSSRTIADIPLPLPSVPEQRRIVAEIEKQFTRLEAGVAALRRVQANLKRYRAAVLKAACEGRLVPTEVKDWKDGSLRDVLVGIEAGKSFRCEERPPTASEIGVVKVSAVTWGTYNELESKTCLDPDRIEERYLVSPNDFLFSRANTIELIGACVIAQKVTLRVMLSDKILRFHLSAAVNPKWVLYWLRSDFGRSEIERLATGNQDSMRNIGQERIRQIAMKLPPLVEQTRIVAEVERRLSVVEELEAVVSASLQRATRLRQSILQKAFSGELVTPMPVVQLSDIIPPLKPEHIHQPNSHFARALLSAEIVHRLHREPTFGRIKHQKIFHLCEHIAQIEEIQGEYHREVAGPLDSKLIYANEAELKKQKWYQEAHRDSFGHAYQPLAKAGGHHKYLERYWPEKLPMIEKLIELMRTWDTDRCEIFCTAYAAWNDLVLWGKQATEENILHEILERWHDSKKRFPPDRWRKAIDWMRKEEFIPTGFGKPTRKPK
jgi:type I restriction enzyme S subunit